MTRFRYGMAVLAATAFLISGCGGGDSSLYKTADGSGGTVSAQSAAARQAAPVQDAAGATGEATRNQAQQVKIEPADRSIIYTAELRVRAKDVAAAADRAKAVATGAGGYVSEEKSSSFSRGAEAVIVFKVPPPRYADVLAQLGRDLGKRQSMHQGAQDVTEEVADVDSRVKSAQFTLEQFRTLLSKATKIGEILSIEREISTREAELEALQARQKALAAQTGMATITLTLLSEATPSAKPKKPSSGFLAGLGAGWRALVKFTEVALTVLGALLPWLVAFGLIWLVAMVIWRRFSPRRTAQPAQAAPRAQTPVAQTPVAQTPLAQAWPAQAPGSAASGTGVTPAGPTAPATPES